MRPDKLYVAAQKAVELLCKASQHPGDEFDLAAMALGNEADLIPQVDPVVAEREACAKLADSKHDYDRDPYAKAMAAHIAAAIRARGETKT